jgi:hypothetical protein
MGAHRKAKLEGAAADVRQFNVSRVLTGSAAAPISK